MPNKITKIEVQKNNKNRINLFLDFEYAFSCDTELVYKYGLKVDKEIEAEDIKAIADSDNFIKAKNDALRYIERSYKTSKQIMDKLLQKGYEKEIGVKVLEFMEQYNFVDDEKFARIYINEKQEKLGKSKIKYDLARRGIDEQIITKMLSSTDNDKQEDGAYQLAKKKYDILIKKEQDVRKIYQKLSRFLISKGYSWDLTKSVVKKIISVDIE